MIKGDIRGNYCVYTWDNDGSNAQLISRYEWKYEAFAACDKWNKENVDSGRTAGIGWIHSDGRIESYIGS